MMMSPSTLPAAVEQLLSSHEVPNLVFFAKQDIRYPVGETFNAYHYRLLGRATANLYRLLLGEGPETVLPVVVGHDVRLTSEELFAAFCQGLQEANAQPIRLGMIPTPAMYFAENWLNEHSDRLPAMGVERLPVGGVIITASHNPSEYNGAKFTFHRKPLNEQHLAALKILFQQAEQALQDNAPTAANPPQVADFNALGEYRQWLQNALIPREALPAGLRPLKVVVDAGNATGGLLGPDVLRDLGVEVIELFCEPDGRFPNHHPDPCVQANLRDLQAAVLQHGADLGVAYDGDSDRLGVVDEKGQVIPGDKVTLMFSEGIIRDWRTQQQNDPQLANAAGPQPKIVFEVKSTQLLTDRLAELGAEPVMAPTGHAIMKETIYKLDAVFGGEMSGHIFFRDPYGYAVRHWGYDDPFYATGRLVRLLQQKQGQPLSTLLAHLPATYLTEEKRPACPRHLAPQVMASLAESLPKAMQEECGVTITNVVTLDGLRLNFNGGFVLIRPSGTEPKMTTRVEATSPEQAEALEAVLLRLAHATIDQFAGQPA